MIVPWEDTALGEHIHSDLETFRSNGPIVTLPPELALLGLSGPSCGGKLEDLVFV